MASKTLESSEKNGMESKTFIFLNLSGRSLQFLSNFIPSFLVGEVFLIQRVTFLEKFD